MIPAVQRSRCLRQLPLGLLLLTLAWARPLKAEVKIEAQLQPESAAVGEQVILSVTVEGAINLDQGPNIAPVDGLEIQGAGQSTNISIVNGRMSRSITFQYLIFAQRSGQYTIGPIEVRDGGKAYRSSGLTLNVASGGGQAPRPPAGGRPGVATTPSGTSEEPEPEERGNLFVRTEVDRDHAVLGEQITLRFLFFQRAGFPLLETPQYTPPSSEGFWREDLPPQRTSTRMVRGETYQVTELVYALFPTQTGRLEIGAGGLDCSVRDRGGSRDPFSFFGGFFGAKQVRLRSRPISVRVDPLPQPKPVDFGGGVGSYTLQAALDRSEVAQNEPITLTLTVEGEGNVSTVGDPTLPDLVGFRTYQSGSDVKTEHAGDALKGKKTFSVVLVPESTGRKEVPPFHLSVFDPGEHRYVRLESRVLAINVLPARPGSSAGEGGEVTRMGRDLRTIRMTAHLYSEDVSRPWRRAGFWLFQCIPVLLLGAAFAWRMSQERREANWGAVLSRGAAGRFRRELTALSHQTATAPAKGFDRLDAALERYLTDRFHLPVRGLTREDLISQLDSGGVGDDALRTVRSICERCDFARFAPQAQTIEDWRRALSDAAALPEALEKKTQRGSRPLPLLLLMGMVASLAISGTAWASARLTPAQAASAFEQGNQAYGRGDYRGAAREYGRVLAGGYEAPDLFLNLGNASYKLGRLGWAVYYYQRGRTLAPQDPDLKANMDLALQETKDKVPEIDSSRFLSWLVRQQDRASLADALRRAALFWWLFLLLLGLRLAASGPAAAGWGKFWQGRPGTVVLATFGLLLLLALGWTAVKALQTGAGPGAVVVADELSVRSNPDGEATVEFTLHAGTRVRLGRSVRGFREVLFSEKLRGWGGAEGLADLNAPGAAALHPDDAEAILGRFQP